MDDKNPVGRPRIEIDYEQAKSLARIGCTHNEMASFFHCSVDTIDKRCQDWGYGNFTDFYKTYCDQGKISLRRLQYKSAQKGNVTMQIWLGKQWLGQSDKEEVGDPGAFQLSYNLDDTE